MSHLWTRWCIFLEAVAENLFSHKWNPKGFSPACLCTSSQVAKTLCRNAQHCAGIPCVWDLLCSQNACHPRAFFSHKTHTYGCSPVWSRIWSTKAPEVRKPLPQTAHRGSVHRKRFSPVWVTVLLSNQAWVLHKPPPAYWTCILSFTGVHMCDTTLLMSDSGFT